MSHPVFSLEIMVNIALVDLAAYRAMLALPPVARYFSNYPSASDKFVRCVEEGGRKIWYKGDKIHCDGDNPAIITDKILMWVKHGKLCRGGDLPAVKSVDGLYMLWVKDGLPHRDGDNPAFINGRVRIYYKNGSFHRDGGKCALVNPEGVSYRVFNLNDNNRAKFNIQILDFMEFDITDMSLSMIARRISSSIFWERTHNILHGCYQNGLPHNETGPALHSKGEKYTWYKNGKEQSVNGRPSTVSPTLRVWCNEGMLDRPDGPAIITPDGEFWFTKGVRDRKDGLPACVYNSGKREYWENGKRHNINGPAIEYANGGTEYWVNGVRHNPDGPAVKCKNGRVEYYFNGKLHNPNGAARIYPDGSQEYYINGKRMCPF